MKRSKTNREELEQITFDSLLDDQPAQSEDELLNDIEVLINKQRTARKEDQEPKKRGRKASPKHVRVKVRLSEPATALPSAIVSHKDEQAQEQDVENTKEMEVKAFAPAYKEVSMGQARAQQRLVPEEVKREMQEAALPEETQEAALPEEKQEAALPEEMQEADLPEEMQEAASPEEMQEADLPEEMQEADLSEEMQQATQTWETQAEEPQSDEAREKSQEEPQEKSQEEPQEEKTEKTIRAEQSDADQDEQERLLRQQRVAMFTKPDILLETPYTVTVGKRRVTRYRLEFGRPDSSIPPEISSSTAGYVSKIDDADEKLIKKKKRSIRQKNVAREISSWVVSIASAVLIAFLLYSFVFVFVKVDGPSMMDTLHDQNYLFVWRLGYKLGTPQRGDVVICHYPDAEGKYDDVNYVKRVLGLPGEQVSMKDGYVYVDGRVVDEPYITPLRRGSYTMEPIVLGAGEYFVLGDNRINSADSRQVGPIKGDQIIGKAVQKLLPLNEFSTIK